MRWFGMSRKRTFAWLFALIITGTIIGVVIVLILRFINAPVASTVNLVSAQTRVSPTPRQPNQLAGLAIELSYPGIFDQIAQVKNDSQAVEQYNLGSKGDYKRSIAVSVRALPSSNLADDSNYRYRQNSKTEYTEGSSTINGEPVAIMTKLDKTEKTLFWAHKGRVVTVAVVSTNSRDSVADILAMIQPTVRWRQ